MTVYSNMLSVVKEINFPVFLSVFVILCYVVHFACKCTLHVARCLLTVALNFKHIALHAAVADFNILVTSAELLRCETAEYCVIYLLDVSKLYSTVD